MNLMSNIIAIVLLLGTIAGIPFISTMENKSDRYKRLSIATVLTVVFGMWLLAMSQNFPSKKSIVASEEAKKDIAHQIDMAKVDLVKNMVKDLPIPAIRETKYLVVGKGDEGTATADLIMVQKMPNIMDQAQGKMLPTGEVNLYRTPLALKNSHQRVEIGDLVELGSDLTGYKWQLIKATPTAAK